MLADGDGLLAAVLASPGDDTPRLVYADWLEEYGEEARAEFIRVQCELAGLKCQNDKGEFPGFITRVCHQLRGECRHCDLYRRESELWNLKMGGGFAIGNVYHLLPGSASVIGQENLSTSRKVSLAIFRRGFVDEVRCSCLDWLRHGREVVRSQPVTKVVLAGLEFHFGSESDLGNPDALSAAALGWARGPEGVRLTRVLSKILHAPHPESSPDAVAR